MSKLSRSEQRELIFQLLYEQGFNDEPIDELISTAAKMRDFEPTPFMTDEIYGILSHKNEIDELITSACRGWTLERIPRVPLAIMRTAVYEMKYDDSIDVGVSINEAVELAKKYGADDDKSFVNGILGTIAKGQVK